MSWVCREVTGAPEPTDVLARAGVSLIDVNVNVSVPLAEAEAEAEAMIEPPPPRHSEVVAAGSYALDLDLDDLDAEIAIVVEELPPLDETAYLEGGEERATEHETALPPACDEPFTVLLASLIDIAIGAGSPYVASVLPGLLLEGQIEHATPDEVTQALAGAGIAQDGIVSAAWIARTNAWRAILSGTSDDFGACGAAMLDEWAAELLACLLGAPARAVALKRDLRARGIAAFGLVEAA